MRYVALRALTALCFCIIGARLWSLQVVSSVEYRQSADQNRFRLVPVDAPRGIIYDRTGRLLVRNVPSFTVSVVPAGLPEKPLERWEVMSRLSDLLDVPFDPADQGTVDPTDVSAPSPSGLEIAAIERTLAERTISPYSPVRVASNVDRQAAFIIEEEHLDLPGVLVSAEPLRQYEDGPLTAHILGYVGFISKESLQSYVDDGYQPDDRVGLTGVELTSEPELRGIKGQKHIEVDAFEREVATISLEPPVPGHNVRLTLDLELQAFVEETLREGIRKAGSDVGVAVAMDPRSGEVLAMVSLPSYDNNLFSGGISYHDYALVSSDRRRPLVNHAISGLYPPGSTFKIVPASAILEEHVVDEHTRLECQGTLLLPSRLYPDDPTKAQEFYCWQERGHGSLNIVGGIQHSCDIFFYQVSGGYRGFPGLGMDRLAEYSRMYGFGEPTGVELSGEAAGLVPNDRWKRQNYGEQWVTGDTYNAAIGQGYVLVTPLQLLNATVAVANGGTLFRPQLVREYTDANGDIVRSFSPDPIRELDISPRNLALTRLGMRYAVTEGTAWLANVPGLSVAGKTGTAEYPGVDEDGNLLLDEEGNLPTHAWFTAFAPYEDPELAIVVFLEGGGEGSQTAVPVAAQILRYYFGIPEPDRPAAQ